MKTYLVQVKVYGFTHVDAEDWEAAEKKAKELPSTDFCMSRDCDIDVLSEADYLEENDE
jgi:hypothetical protein